MKRKIPVDVIAVLKEVRDSSTMEMAQFGSNPEQNAEIKEAVKLYFDTYVTHKLDGIIDYVEGKETLDGFKSRFIPSHSQYNY